MAGKNAKKATSTSSKIPPNKLPEIKPELVTPSQLVRYNPQQASSQNNPSSSRMVSLGKPVQSSSSFAKALVEPYDPFNKKIVPATPAAPIKHRNNKKAVSPYFLLFDEKLFPIEFEHRRIEDPLLLIKSYFPLHPTDGVQQHYCPSIPYKTIQFYQNILQQEGSVEIKSIFGKTPATKNQILFHKVEIIKFTHLRDWGHPWHSKPLKNHSIEYNYYDYIDAWYQILLIQYPDMSHSWFIQFNKDFQFTKPECQPPMWFLKWWSKHGSQTEIIPDTLWNTEPPKTKKDPPLSTRTIRQALNQFVQMYRCREYISRFPPVLLFCFKYKVEDQPSSSIPNFLSGKSPEELAEICKLAAQACQAASASASGKGKSPAKSSASSEGSTTEMVHLSQFSVPMKKNWYEDSLYQDAQDPNAELEEYEALLEEQFLE
uniref:Uncharacterized protein n=1 Tax=Fagus sylvatica TaxID=28930 RepID=A0A2N9GMH7_FAGSY